ncbi:MAG: hypothetical protein M0Z88_10980 [Actinomycetota bacterium]|nr:hypothetical protein [Actinomycetota bacterium]
MAQEGLDWSPTGAGSGQHRGDVVIDDICRPFLVGQGLSVYSEESGFTGAADADAPVVVLDPVDGSTNASHSIPLFTLSCALIEDDELVAGYVEELTNHARYYAVRGEGAYFMDEPVTTPRGERPLRRSLVAVNGYPPAHLGWGQFRALGSAALELAMVASGQLDAYIDCSRTGLAPWDYLGALAVLREAGCSVASLGGGPAPEEEIYGVRRRIAAAGSPELLAELVSAWVGSVGA